MAQRVRMPIHLAIRYAVIKVEMPVNVARVGRRDANVGVGVIVRVCARSILCDFVIIRSVAILSPPSRFASRNQC